MVGSEQNSAILLNLYQLFIGKVEFNPTSHFPQESVGRLAYVDFRSVSIHQVDDVFKCVAEREQKIHASCKVGEAEADNAQKKIKHSTRGPSSYDPMMI